MGAPRIPDTVKKDLLLKALLFLGLAGAGGAVGYWSGKTWVFTPTLEPPAVTQVQTKSMVWQNERVPVARVVVRTDGVGRIGLVYTYEDAEGMVHLARLPADAHADQYVFDLRRDLKIGWSVLDLPAWVKSLEVWSFPGGWDGRNWSETHKVRKVK